MFFVSCLSHKGGRDGRRQLSQDGRAVVHVLDDLVHLLLGRRGRSQEDRRLPARDRRQFSKQRLGLRVLRRAEDQVMDTLGREAETRMEAEPEV